MSAFTENLIVSPLPNGKTWVLRKTFSFYVGEKEDNEIIEVPVGFITDFASVPRVFWWILPRWGKYGNAAVIHDYLYWIKDGKYDRKRADEIFLEGMLILEVRNWKAWIMYLAVRLCGKIAWDRNVKTMQKGGKKRIDLPEETIEIPQMQLKDFVLEPKPADSVKDKKQKN